MPSSCAVGESSGRSLYEELLQHLRSYLVSRKPGRGHSCPGPGPPGYAADTVQAAVEMASRRSDSVWLGVRFCLYDRLLDVTPSLPPLDLTHRPELLQPTTNCLLQRYGSFLRRRIAHA
ncbi:MAG: hypothetical protein KF753_16760 [Caldilineaceae bacterium]|nr:hypothetical protein [Caldilineaceae bacterium]